MGKKKKPVGECAFCGKPAFNWDHVPPQGMFAKPRQGLIVVPSCERCNSASTKDDEVLQRLALMSGTERSKDAAEVCATVFRAIDKPEARGLRKNFFQSITPVKRWSSHGPFWLGHDFHMVVPGDRIAPVLTKIVRGLFFDARKKRLPVGYTVGLHNLGAQLHEPSLSENETQILDFEERVIGDSAFAFRQVFAPQNEFISICRMTFYGTTTFMGYTLKDMGTHKEMLLLKDGISLEQSDMFQ